MANVIIKDLIVNTTDTNLLNPSMGFVQDLSEYELGLQGGCRQRVTFQLPDGRVITFLQKCLRLPPNHSFIV